MTASPHRAGRHWRLIAVTICAPAAVALGGPLLLRGPAFVEEVSVVNPSEYDIHVEASGDDTEGWVSVTTAGRASTTAAGRVIDQGALWIFRFSAQGRQGGEVRFTAIDLKEAGWSLQIPDTVIERLREQGATPTP